MITDLRLLKSLKSYFSILFIVVLALFVNNGFGQAVSIWTNPITGTNLGNSNPYTIGDALVNSNLTVSGIGRGVTLTPSNSTNTYNTGSWPTSTTIDLNAYFNFTVAPITGYKISFSSFVYSGTGSSKQPSTFAFRTDANANNFTTNIGIPSLTGTSIPLSVSDISSSTSFRLYGWNASSGSGRDWAVNDFTFNGSILGSSTTALSGFGYIYSFGPSTAQSFQVNGNGLTTANASVTINGSLNYEVSTTSATTGFGATASLTASGGSIAGQTVWVRLKTGLPAGTYNETINFGGGGITSIPITVSGAVAKQPLTITANNVNKIYGTALISPGAGQTTFTSSGLVNGETIGTLSIAYGTGAVATAGVGSYNTVTPSAATGGTFNPSNYNITYTNGNIIVGAKALTITANDVNKTYGT
ncbi:MAG: MBG domain-containing protein, partial [Ferruginibacter sp.]